MSMQCFSQEMVRWWKFCVRHLLATSHYVIGRRRRLPGGRFRALSRIFIISGMNTFAMKVLLLRRCCLR